MARMHVREPALRGKSRVRGAIDAGRSLRRGRGLALARTGDTAAWPTHPGGPKALQDRCVFDAHRHLEASKGRTTGRIASFSSRTRLALSGHIEMATHDLQAPVRASLPMYNLPEMRCANAAFWEAVRQELASRGARVPVMLELERKPVPAEIEPDTLLTQVCGYPLQTIYRDQAALLGAPVYCVNHCDGPTHAGVFVVHRNSASRTVADLRGCCFVFNSVHSNSGMNLPRRAIAEVACGRPFFGSITETHSQPENIERIARGEA